jgi:hypothetical protein
VPIYRWSEFFQQIKHPDLIAEGLFSSREDWAAAFTEYSFADFTPTMDLDDADLADHLKVHPSWKKLVKVYGEGSTDLVESLRSYLVSLVNSDAHG